MTYLYDDDVAYLYGDDDVDHNDHDDHDVERK